MSNPSSADKTAFSVFDFKESTDHSFLFKKSKLKLANARSVALLLENLIVLGFLPSGIISPDGTLNMEALLKFAQKGKQDHSLTPDQVEKNKAILNDPDATKKEKNAAKLKLNRHEKTQGDRNKQKRDNNKKKKPKKKKKKKDN